MEAEPQPRPEPEPEPEMDPNAESEPRWSDEYDEDEGVAADAEYDERDEEDQEQERVDAAVDGSGRAIDGTWSSDSEAEGWHGVDEGGAEEFDGDGLAAADYRYVAGGGAPDRWARHAAGVPEPPESLCCPITLALLSDPVTTADGYTYERRALTEWFDRGHRSSPVTRKRLASHEMHTNFLARQAVESYQQKVSGIDSPTKPDPPSRSEVLHCVDRFEDERSIDTGEIRRRNRRTRRAAAWDKQINHIENWIATVDPASGQTYYYNRLTRVTQWEEPSAEHHGKVASVASGDAIGSAARPVAATHPGMAAFPGMKPADTGRQGTANDKGRAYGLCVWLSAVILLAASGATVALAVWLAGLWPDAAARPHEALAAAAACIVMQAGLLVAKPRRWLGQTLVFVRRSICGATLAFADVVVIYLAVEHVLCCADRR